MITRHLHFNNKDEFKPAGAPDCDKLFKIWLLIDKVRERSRLILKETYYKHISKLYPQKLDTNSNSIIQPNLVNGSTKIKC